MKTTPIPTLTLDLLKKQLEVLKKNYKNNKKEVIRKEIKRIRKNIRKEMKHLNEINTVPYTKPHQSSQRGLSGNNPQEDEMKEAKAGKYSIIRGGKEFILLEVQNNEITEIKRSKDLEEIQELCDSLNTQREEDKEEERGKGKKKVKLGKKMAKAIQEEKEKANKGKSTKEILKEEKMGKTHKSDERPLAPKGAKVDSVNEKTGNGSGLIPKVKVEIPEKIFKKFSKTLQGLIELNQTGDENDGRKARRGLRKLGFKLSDETTWAAFME